MEEVDALNKIQNNIEKAEKEFHELKEKYFGDKIKELESEIESLNNGTNQGQISSTIAPPHNRRIYNIIKT